MPLQTYFRINTENINQFEQTLIITNKNSYVHYIKNCTTPIYSTNSLHSTIIKLITKPNARIHYTTVQNWSQNVFNLMTKRTIAQTNTTVK